MTEYQPDQLRNIIEAALLVASRPMSLAQLEAVFEHDENPPDREQIRAALDGLQAEYETRGIELVEVASGWRMQSRESMSPWIANLFQEKAPRYSRALLETLVLIAYRQPITRGEIEEVRGVAVSSNIVRTLIERDWVKIVGHRDVPGRPSLLGTTKHFLDYFNLKKIGELPTLSEIKALDEIAPELAQEVAMLDQTIAPDEEVVEEGDGANGQDAVDEGQSAQEDDENQDVDSGDATGLKPGEADDDVIISASNGVDVDLSLDSEASEPETNVAPAELDEIQERDEESEEAGLSSDAELSDQDASLDREADEASEDQSQISGSNDKEVFADESLEHEDVAVAEATIDALSTTVRPETELLH